MHLSVQMCRTFLRVVTNCKPIQCKCYLYFWFCRPRERGSVGGLTKLTVRREIAADTNEMVHCLSERYGESESPIYFFKEILQSDLEVERAKSRLTVYETVVGSSTFQVILICPGTSVIKASPRLCMCKECKNEFGS